VKRIPKGTVPFSLRENRESPQAERGGETRRSVGDSTQVLAEQLSRAGTVVVRAVGKEMCVVSVSNWGSHWLSTNRRLRHAEILPRWVIIVGERMPSHRDSQGATVNPGFVLFARPVASIG
jgi:hypothetical protein